VSGNINGSFQFSRIRHQDCLNSIIFNFLVVFQIEGASIGTVSWGRSVYPGSRILIFDHPGATEKNVRIYRIIDNFLGKKYYKNVGWELGIPDPGFRFRKTLSRIPGSKKTPDPGSATLNFKETIAWDGSFSTIGQMWS
jgi:hypothetical protein